MRDNGSMNDQAGIDLLAMVAMVINSQSWHSLNIVHIEFASRLDVGSEGKQGVKD